MGATSLENVTCGGAAASAAITNSDSTTIKANTLTRSARHPSNVGFVMTGSFRLFISALIISSPDQTTYINRAWPKPAPVFSRGAAAECSPGRKPGVGVVFEPSPGGAQDCEDSYAPGLRSCRKKTPGSRPGLHSAAAPRLARTHCPVSPSIDTRHRSLSAARYRAAPP